MKSISVIIPIYNVEKYVERCLKSVMEQDITGMRVECIIVDDCGTDGSMDIVNRVVDSYQGNMEIRILKHPENCGLSAARNTGLDAATAEYVLFIDSDDYFVPDSLQYLVQSLKQYPEADIVTANVKMTKTGEMLLRHLKEPLWMDDTTQIMTLILRHRINLYAWNKLIRRSIITDNSLRFFEDVIYEDQPWSYQLFLLTRNILLLPRLTYVYEYNPTSIVNTTFSERRATHVLQSYSTSVNFMLDHPPVGSKYSRNIAADYLLFLSSFLMNGVDVLHHTNTDKDTARRFRSVRLRTLRRSLSYGRVLLSLFLLVLFPPLCFMQKFKWFRWHFNDIQAIVSKVSHMTDFLHRKSRL